MVNCFVRVSAVKSKYRHRKNYKNSFSFYLYFHCNLHFQNQKEFILHLKIRLISIAKVTVCMEI